MNEGQPLERDDWERVLAIAKGLADIRTGLSLAYTHDQEAVLVAEFKALTDREVPPKPFKSDGCTFSTDAFGKDCCVLHDVKYWLGGTRADRKRADSELRECTRLNSKFYSAVQWFGVRVFGRLPLSRSRWGYGWPYPQVGEPEIEY